MPDFNYDQAFSRNIGWVTRDEQKKLGSSRVAIAGMGGVGGIYLLTLARLGIGKFNISDMDAFDIVNFNRQAGANMSTVNKEKVKVMAEQALLINPGLDLNIFAHGVTNKNIDEFLKDVDVYVDGIDVFAMGARELVYKACEEKNIPIVIAGPLGMGTAVVNFLPGRMTYDQYFGFSKANNDTEKSIRFLLGMAPRMLHRKYLVDPSSVNIHEKKGPSTASACQMCAGAASTEALKILLKRKNINSAPVAYQFDAYSYRFIKTWRPWGFKNPLQRLSLFILKRILKKMNSGAR